MFKSQFPGVQHLARKTGFPTVNLVAQNRVAEMMEVHAHLMGAARVQLAFDQAPLI